MARRNCGKCGHFLPKSGAHKCRARKATPVPVRPAATLRGTEIPAGVAVISEQHPKTALIGDRFTKFEQKTSAPAPKRGVFGSLKSACLRMKHGLGGHLQARKDIESDLGVKIAW